MSRSEQPYQGPGESFIPGEFYVAFLSLAMIGLTAYIVGGTRDYFSTNITVTQEETHLLVINSSRPISAADARVDAIIRAAEARCNLKNPLTPSIVSDKSKRFALVTEAEDCKDIIGR